MFVVFDLICGYLVLKINRFDRAQSSRADLAALAVWFYNPITVAIASRGNAESVMACLVLAFVYSFKRRAYLQAGFIYGLAIHFKIYPITYALVIFFNLIDLQNISFSVQWFKSKLIFNYNLIEFAFTSLVTLSSLTWFFYYK